MISSDYRDRRARGTLMLRGRYDEIRPLLRDDPEVARLRAEQKAWDRLRRRSRARRLVNFLFPGIYTRKWY